MRRRFKCDPKWITVRYPARCAEPNCQAEINSGERAFYYPGDKAVYGTRWGHGEKAERDFNAHRIDERFLSKGRQCLHRGSAHYPPVRSEGRKRQTLAD